MSTEARRPIRDGEKGDRRETFKQVPTWKTKAAVDRRQNNRMLRWYTVCLTLRSDHHIMQLLSQLLCRTESQRQCPQLHRWEGLCHHNRLFMAPYLIKAWSTYKDTRIHSFHHAHLFIVHIKHHSLIHSDVQTACNKNIYTQFNKAEPSSTSFYSKVQQFITFLSSDFWVIFLTVHTNIMQDRS